MLIGELCKIIIVYIISFIINKQIEFLIVMSLMISIRGAIGGGHAKSFIGCIVKSSIVLISLFLLASKIKEIPTMVEIIIIPIIIIVLKKVKYKIKLDKSGTNELKNKGLRKKLISIVILYIFVFKSFLEQYYSLVFITICFIVIDYLRMEVKRC